MMIKISTLLTYLFDFFVYKSPKNFRYYFYWITIKIRNVIDFGTYYYCPCCGGHIRYFQIISNRWRIKICPSCGSQDRHRLFWLFLKEKTNLFKIDTNTQKQKKKLLHFAPFPLFKFKLKSMSNFDYITADLFDPDVIARVDITNIQFKTNSVDIIICKHVLEHVEDDKKALEELYRVLKPRGWAIIIVPIDKSLVKTYEDPTITKPEERKIHFGQENHVRMYGLDYIERLQQAGFKVQIYQCTKLFNIKQIRKYGLDKNEDIYYCIK